MLKQNQVTEHYLLYYINQHDAKKKHVQTLEDAMMEAKDREKWHNGHQ